MRSIVGDNKLSRLLPPQKAAREANRCLDGFCKRLSFVYMKRGGKHEIEKLLFSGDGHFYERHFCQR
jgi:hypothetical protein